MPESTERKNRSYNHSAKVADAVKSPLLSHREWLVVLASKEMIQTPSARDQLRGFNYGLPQDSATAPERAGPHEIVLPHDKGPWIVVRDQREVRCGGPCVLMVCTMASTPTVMQPS